MNTQERIELIKEALELITTAQQKVDEALSGTPMKLHYTAYEKYGFSQLLGNGNRYDSSLYTLLENYEELKSLSDSEDQGDEPLPLNEECF